MKDNIEEQGLPDIKRSYLGASLTCKCPRCRQASLFIEKNPYKLKTCLKMPKECPVCGQPTEIEVGFYTGAAYVSYALTIAVSVATFIAWWVLIGISINDNRVWWWLCCNILILLILTPWLMRLSRSLWLSWFVKYDKDWREHPIDDYERTNELGME